MRRCLLVMALVGAIAAGSAGSADAAVGDLGFAGCLADDPSGSGCADLAPVGPEGSLSGVDSVVVSPDGASVYTTGNAAADVGTITRFGATPTGDLTPAGCLADTATAGGCADLPPAGPGGPLSAAQDVAVDAESTGIHATSDRAQIASFALDPSSGGLIYRGCVADDPSLAGCRPASTAGLPPLRGLGAVVAPRHGSVLVTVRNGVASLVPAQEGGLAYIGCVGLGPACEVQDSMQGARDIVLEPSSQRAWVASDLGPDSNGNRIDAITLLTVGPDGAADLTWQCAGNARPCRSVPPASALVGARRLAISPDATSLYVLGDDTVTHLRVGEDGTPWFEGCLTSRRGTGSCNEMSSPGLAGATDIALSPDGRSLYVAVRTRVLLFDRAANGALAYAGCVADGSETDCADVPPAGVFGPFGGTMSLAISPDGSSLYVTSDATSAITHLPRSVDGSPPRGDLGIRAARRGGPNAPPPPVVSTRRKRCRGLDVTVVAKRGRRTVGTNRRDVIIGTSKRDVIDARRGNDVICAGGGADSVIGGAGDDRISGQDGNDRLSGGAGVDHLSGGAGRDRLTGGDGRDVLEGGGGRDVLRGGRGRDRERQ